MKLSQLWTDATAAVSKFFEAPKGFQEFVDKGVPVHPQAVYLTLQHLQRQHG